MKDLSSASKNMCRTVIVDNNPYSFLLQPLNGIPCVPFSAQEPNDTQVYITNPNSFFSKVLFFYHSFGSLTRCHNAKKKKT